ncbi:hypothetical protein BHM03_00021706 [Ensete ventricosum]|nr:hypothetical protein BHM03_00021706 [Ensete ventricosum]
MPVRTGTVNLASRTRDPEPTLALLLPPPLMLSAVASTVDAFLPLLKERTVGSSAIDGCPLELPSLPLMLSGAFAFVIAAATVCSFRRCHCCYSQLPPLSLLRSVVSVAAAIRSFHRRRCCCS